jgi:uncharacterized protein YndB with AHSA1/START domain
MQEVVVRKRIDAARQAVWDVYTDHVSWSRWAGIGAVRLTREGRPVRDGVGCIREIRSGGVAVEEEVIGFEPPQLLTYRVIRGGLPIKNHLGEVRFADSGGATSIEWRCRFDSRVPGVGFVWKAIITGVFRRVLAGLARQSFPAGSRT